MALGVKDSPFNIRDIRDASLIPGSGRSSGEGSGNLLFFSGESHGQRSLVGYSPWGHKESRLSA